MPKVLIPKHKLYDATLYLQHNQQFVDREYTRCELATGVLEYTFNHRGNYLAFCSWASRFII